MAFPGRSNLARAAPVSIKRGFRMNAIKALTFLFSILFSSLVLAQGFTLDELSQLNQAGFDEFRTNVKAKGFSYSDKIEAPYKMVEYQKFANDITSTISKFVYATAKEPNSIQYNTSDKAEFDALKAALLGAGYKSFKSGSVPGSKEKFTDYRKDKHEVRLVEPVKPGQLYAVIVY
jgi:hypothetical protein